MILIYEKMYFIYLFLGNVYELRLILIVWSKSEEQEKTWNI